MAFSLTTNHGVTTTGPLSLGTAQNAGDLMIVGLVNSSGNGLTISSVSDSVGTTYSSYVASGFGNTFAILYGFLAGTGANVLTIAWSAGGSYGPYAEFTGSSVNGAALDGSGQIATGASGTTSALPTITTTGADDLVINHVWSNAGGETFGSPWTAVQTDPASYGALGYQADVASGTYTPNASFSSSVFGSLCLAFKAPTADPATLRTLSSPRLV